MKKVPVIFIHVCSAAVGCSIQLVVDSCRSQPWTITVPGCLLVARQQIPSPMFEAQSNMTFSMFSHQQEHENVSVRVRREPITISPGSNSSVKERSSTSRDKERDRDKEKAGGGDGGVAAGGGGAKEADKRKRSRTADKLLSSSNPASPGGAKRRRT